jgi:RPA family protein
MVGHQQEFPSEFAEMADAMGSAWVMEIDAKKKARIAALSEEMERIHFVNSLYWQRGEAVTSEARAEYQRRLDRLQEIRAELAQVQVGRKGGRD